MRQPHYYYYYRLPKKKEIIRCVVGVVVVVCVSWTLYKVLSASYRGPEGHQRSYVQTLYRVLSASENENNLTWTEAVNEGETFVLLSLADPSATLPQDGTCLVAARSCRWKQT